MNRILVGGLALWFAGLAIAAEPGSERNQMFLDLVKERHLPPLTRAVWSRHVGADCVWVSQGLHVETFEEVAGRQIDMGTRVEIADFQARDYGDVAVLTYVVIQHVPQDGREVTLRLRKLDTYAEQQGRWQLIANAEAVGRPDRVAVPMDPALYEHYAGIYEATLNGKPVRTRVWRDGAKLMAQTEGQETGELKPMSPTLFFDATAPEDGGPENIFVLDSTGRVTEWIYRQAGVEVRSKRVSK